LWLYLKKNEVIQTFTFSLSHLMGFSKAVYPVITYPIYNVTTCPASTTHLFNLYIIKRPEWK